MPALAEGFVLMLPRNPHTHSGGAHRHSGPCPGSSKQVARLDPNMALLTPNALLHLQPES